MKRDLTEKMIEDLNDLGNLFAGTKWPTVETDINQYDAKKIDKALMDDYHQVYQLETDFHDAVNELCQKCGEYRREHEGACDGCRWQKPRRGW